MSSHFKSNKSHKFYVSERKKQDSLKNFTQNLHALFLGLGLLITVQILSKFRFSVDKVLNS